MGYDMYIENPSPDEEDQVEAARAVLRGAADARDALELPSDAPDYRAAQVRVEEAYQALRAVHTSYFRLNIWGMDVARRAMATSGMLTHDAQPEWPDPERYGTTTDEVWSYDGGDDESAPSPIREFLAAVRRCTDAEADHPSGIPCYKLCSNDGWLVTPGEIAAALGWWSMTPTRVRKSITAQFDWWPDWIRYLKRARHQGGFRVY
ncbi:hypothetical protein ADL21_11195 [Streptomyces albus subsp. albus]|nr:hypothetical protein ADL21_11195 [Streptomyces albus subsp. albus]